MAGRTRIEQRVRLLAAVTKVNAAVDRIASSLEAKGWTVESYGVGETTANWSSGFGLTRQWYPAKFVISKVNGTTSGARAALVYAIGKEALSYEGYYEARSEFFNDVVVQTAKDVVDAGKHPYSKLPIPKWIWWVAGGGVALFALTQIATISRAFRR